VWLLIAIFFVICWPLARLLDLILGQQNGTFYGRKELQALVDMHGPEKQLDSPVKEKKRCKWNVFSVKQTNFDIFHNFTIK